MISKLYSPQILRLAGNISHIGRLSDADCFSSKQSKACGSRISVSIKMQDGIITNYAQELSACALTQASAAILATYIIGCRQCDLYFLYTKMQEMLRNNNPVAWGRFTLFDVLASAAEYTPRHSSILLPLLTCLECLEKINEAS